MGSKIGVWRFFSRSAVHSVRGNGGTDYTKIAPNLDLYLWRPILSEPPLCSLKELQDGTYGINDLMDMHEALNLMIKVKENNANNR